MLVVMLNVFEKSGKILIFYPGSKCHDQSSRLCHNVSNKILKLAYVDLASGNYTILEQIANDGHCICVSLEE